MIPQAKEDLMKHNSIGDNAQEIDLNTHQIRYEHIMTQTHEDGNLLIIVVIIDLPSPVDLSRF